MGFRNPFRFDVDMQTGWVNLADYGPDRNPPTTNRGPEGLVELNVIKADVKTTAQALVLNVEGAMAMDYLTLANQLRTAGIRTEVSGGDDKLGKQMKYAARAGVPVTIL